MYTYNMTNDHGTPPQLLPILTVGGLILFVVIANLIPGSWFGIHAPVGSHVRLDLDQLTHLPSFNDGTQGVGEDGTINWNQFVSSTYDGSTNTQNTASLDPNAVQALNDPNNLTGSFSKNLYVASTYLNQQGMTDPGSQQQTVSTLLSNEASKLTITTYSVSDLHVAATESKASLKLYGNAVAPLLLSALTQQMIADDLTAIKNFANTEDKNSLTGFIKNKNTADSALKKLLQISVPPSAITYHLLLINRIAAYENTLNDLSKIDTDSVRGLLAFQNYTDTVTLVLKMRSQLSNYFNIQNVVFSAQDPGYLFTAGYTTN